MKYLKQFRIFEADEDDEYKLSANGADYIDIGNGHPKVGGVTREISPGEWLEMYNTMSDGRYKELESFFSKFKSIKVRDESLSEKPIKTTQIKFDDGNKTAMKVDIFFPMPFFGYDGFLKYNIFECDDDWFVVTHMSKGSTYRVICDQLSGVEKLFRDKYLKYYTES